MERGEKCRQAGTDPSTGFRIQASRYKCRAQVYRYRLKDFSVRGLKAKAQDNTDNLAGNEWQWDGYILQG